MNSRGRIEALNFIRCLRSAFLPARPGRWQGIPWPRAASRALARIAHSEGDLQARDIHISSAQHAAKDRDSLRDQCLTGYFEERLVGSTNTNWAELAATMSLEPKAFFPKL